MVIVGDYVVMYKQKIIDVYGIHDEAIKGMRDNMRLIFLREKVDVLHMIFGAFSDPRWPRFVGDAVCQRGGG
jgi:hypothetical protein